jgi:eukaryotic-like serine/threonine-protein kinase
MLCIWLALKADCIRSLNHYEKWIFDVKWHVGDDLLVTASGDNVIRVWQVKEPGVKGIQELMEEPHVIRVLKSHVNWVLNIKYFPYNNEELLISASADKTIRTWNVKKGEVISIGRRHQSWINSVDTAQIKNIETNELMTIVACGSSDNRVSLWQVTTRRDGVAGKLVCIKTLLQHKDWVTSVMFTHDNKYILSKFSTYFLIMYRHARIFVICFEQYLTKS